MPSHRHRHNRRKNFKYWINRLFQGSSRNKRQKRNEDKESYAGTRFLTIEEVKAAQAEANERMGSGGQPNVVSVHEEANRPQQPKIHLHFRKKRSLGYRIKKFLAKIKFKSWKRKYSSSSPAEFHYLTLEEIKKAKSTPENSEAGFVSADTRTIRTPGLQQDTPPVHKHKHRRRKKRFWRIFNFRKKRKILLCFRQKEK